jgi:hypothetical protein
MDGIRPNSDQNVGARPELVHEKGHTTNWTQKTMIVVCFGVDGISLFDIVPPGPK